MATIRDTLLSHVRELLAGSNENHLAGELGIDTATLHRWLKGERSISISTAEHLAERFGLELKPSKKRR